AQQNRAHEAARHPDEKGHGCFLGLMQLVARFDLKQLELLDGKLFRIFNDARDQPGRCSFLAVFHYVVHHDQLRVARASRKPMPMPINNAGIGLRRIRFVMSSPMPFRSCSCRYRPLLSRVSAMVAPAAPSMPRDGAASRTVPASCFMPAPTLDTVCWAFAPMNEAALSAFSCSVAAASLALS